MKKMGFKEFLYIVPVLFLIGVFSLWPVIQSFTYSFFDYRLNDQTKSELLLSEKFNVDLYSERSFYIERFLNQSMPEITDGEDRQQVEKLIADLNDLNQQFEGQEGVIKISGDVTDQVKNVYESADQLVAELSETYELVQEENLPLLIDDIQNSLVQSNFIGLEGYAKALTDDRLQYSLGVTLAFTIISVFLELVFGLGMAMIMNKAIQGQGFIRVTSLIPWAIPTAVAALMWSYLYDGHYGVVAAIFESLGFIENSTDLLQTSLGGISAVILADVWKTTPYMAILLLAGLQNIPNTLYEAASIDGASKIQQFFKVTLPLLKPSILVALLFRTLDAFRVFDLIYVLTSGGPGGATETMSVYAYKVMFGQMNFGYGSVIVMIMFICVAIIATIYVKVLGTNLMEKN
ncbi:carbohydrate ABC transporter membrane protein 1 (CUT1 family) [Melghiribacillus thermohalophilus]|uniref:Carbohydrate ABC transporter membrane protein 1 (CUT1 family) n=1 Tax=Melghiribacillus thermohalophilus TaxID=1324956 RepID=A0A4R3NC69_9BACI|nr:sugar ABC transporter permease [Melghiribacillus thermohalophilus]TCT26325.1 carbohydrate ABC transporter membrane protein 1 (CUT1 family) [Melghiribacillus thermohalophilus]